MPLEPKLGRYFHVLDPDTHKIEYQGKIIKRHRGGWFTVQFFDWMTGDPTNTDSVHIGVMSDGNWRFYNFASEWRAAYAAHEREVS